MKTKAKEKAVCSEHKSCSDLVITSREQAVALRKTGEALAELAKELQKVSEYDQQNSDVNHAVEDRQGDLKITFLEQADKLLNDQINALRRSQTRLRRAIKQHYRKN